jgi:hypothetical protein
MMQDITAEEQDAIRTVVAFATDALSAFAPTAEEAAAFARLPAWALILGK